MNGKKITIIVQKGLNSVEVARFVNDNIIELNKAGILIRVEKIKDLDDELIDALRKRSITRLPAIPMRGEKPIVGKDQIIEYLETLMSGRVTKKRPGYITADFGSDPQLADYYMRELYDGAKDGKLAPRADDEETDDGSEDLSRKMRTYQMNTPKHRSSGSRAKAPPKDKPSKSRQDNIEQDEDDDDFVPQKRSNYSNDPDFSERNVETTVNYKGGGVDDAMDKRMLDAWMQNNPSNYE